MTEGSKLLGGCHCELMAQQRSKGMYAACETKAATVINKRVLQAGVGSFFLFCFVCLFLLFFKWAAKLVVLIQRAARLSLQVYRARRADVDNPIDLML